MLKYLGIGMLLVACSSESGLVSSESSGAGGEYVAAGTSGAAVSTTGGTDAASAGASAGSRADAGEGGSGNAGAPVGGGGAAGTHSEEAGAAGALVNGGSSGAAGSAGATSASGSATGGGGAGGGASGSSSTGGSSGAAGGTTAGAGGGTTEIDPCVGEKHWDSTERWTDYAQGDQRVFGGVLWHCQVPSACTAYPGHSSSPGWFKDSDCKGGPTSEVAACQCAAGQCCDGCYVRPTSHFCGEVVRTAQCLGAVVNQCGGGTDTIDKDYWNLFCDGASSGECTRWGAHTKYSNGDCPANTGCLEQGDQASCVACN